MEIKTQQVGNFSKKSAVITNITETVGYAIDSMLKYQLRSFPLISNDGKLTGIVTSTDVLKCMFDTADINFLKKEIKEIMTTDLITTKSDQSLRDTILLMYNSGISGVPIVSDGNIDGIFTDRDIIQLDALWETTSDNTIIGDYGIGRLVKDNDFVTENHTMWQAADALIKTGQRQILYKNTELDEIQGVITILSILSAVVSSVISNERPIDLQTASIQNVTKQTVDRVSTPIKISEVRRIINSNNIEALPIFDVENAVLIVTEKDLVGYIANHI